MYGVETFRCVVTTADAVAEALAADVDAAAANTILRASLDTVVLLLLLLLGPPFLLTAFPLPFFVGICGDAAAAVFSAAASCAAAASSSALRIG